MTRVLHCLPLLLLAALSLPASAASTSNLAREKSYADQIEKYLVVGDAIRLEARGVKFMAIDTKPENPPVKGAVILLHGRGVHPAWGFFDKLRMDIAENKGWRTLSIQLPILDTDTALDQYGPTLPEAFERIDAAIAHLRKSGVKKNRSSRSFERRRNSCLLSGRTSSEHSAGRPADRSRPGLPAVRVHRAVRQPPAADP